MKQLVGICVLVAVMVCVCLAAGGTGAAMAPVTKGPVTPTAAKAVPVPAVAPKMTGTVAGVPSVKPAAPSGKELVLDLGGGQTMKLVSIPAGKFMMGEKEKHEVTLTKTLYMGATLVTQAQYEAIMGMNPSRFKGPTNPVESISWDDAVNFCKKLEGKVRQTVRLPTEAEWEYACRAGTATMFSFGDDEAALDDYGWHLGNAGGTTHPVATKKPNAWGLYDMHGNVWQWCSDLHGDYPSTPQTDPQGARDGPYRIVRGGGCLYRPVQCRSGNRAFYAGVDREILCGFRVVVPGAAS
jgi:formylglycine-generating enzyme required for sulfatase activity